jgi:hypothetical protein
MMNMKQMLGEAGRTISNRDMELAQQMMGMSDNEPMMQDRSSANQMFSIDARIENLMKSYNMLVNAREFGRAQEVADQIDQLQQQKIGIQAQNDPTMMGSMEDLMRNVPNMPMGPPDMPKMPKGKPDMPISNREYISKLLDAISE